MIVGPCTPPHIRKSGIGKLGSPKNLKPKSEKKSEIKVKPPYQRRVTDAGRDAYGAKAGTHDNLIVALAAWWQIQVGANSND